jgi:nucleoid-associated protein YgaU
MAEKKSDKKDSINTQNYLAFGLIFVGVFIVFASIILGARNYIPFNFANTQLKTIAPPEVPVDSITLGKGTIENLDNQITNPPGRISDEAVQTVRDLNEIIETVTGQISEESNQMADSNEKIYVTGHTQSGYEKTQINQESIKETNLWNATDYNDGDIKGSVYTVQQGDTLWEIAEAYYGGGANWTQILDSNADNIGFLADGSQALIYPGQVLYLK